jgi:hypothetical protein
LRPFKHRINANGFHHLWRECFIGWPTIGQQIGAQFALEHHGASGSNAEFHDALYAIAKKMNVPPLALIAAGAVLLISKPAL